MSHELRLARYVVLFLVAVALFGALSAAWARGRPDAAAKVLGAPLGPAPSLTGHGQSGPVGPMASAGSQNCGLDSSDIFGDGQVLSYYGSPRSSAMGILGELPPDELIERLQEHAQTYDALNGPTRVQPALHIVQAVAQKVPGRDGLYLQHLDDRMLTKYVDLACAHGMLVFLDLQIGRSNVASEIERVLPYLKRPNVHLALDPEFAMPSGEEPGQSIGWLTGKDINDAQELLSEVAQQTGLDKILIVHQFLDSMIRDREVVRDRAGVQLVIDMDGFGPADIKQVKYGWYTHSAKYAGIKLFFQQDPDLMTEQQVLALRPNVIIYQ